MKVLIGDHIAGWQGNIRNCTFSETGFWAVLSGCHLTLFKVVAKFLKLLDTCRKKCNVNLHKYSSDV